MVQRHYERQLERYGQFIYGTRDQASQCSEELGEQYLRTAVCTVAILFEEL
jgi:hypothetical protein